MHFEGICDLKAELNYPFKNATSGFLESPKIHQLQGALPLPVGALPLDPTRFWLGHYAPSQHSQTYRLALQLQILFVLALLIN